MTILVIVGPRGSWKTSLGKALARELRVPFDDGLRKELYGSNLVSSRDYGAMGTREFFDRLVTTLELARDRELSHFPVRIVESWHPWNLMMAEKTSPDLAWSLCRQIRKCTSTGNAMLITLMVSTNTLLNRGYPVDEVWESLSNMQRCIDWTESLGMPLLRPVLSPTTSVDELAWTVLRSLELPIPVRRPVFVPYAWNPANAAPNKETLFFSSKELASPQVQA